VDEPDPLAFGRLTTAQAVLVAGDIARSMRLFDEVMVSVTMGDVSPIPSGIHLLRGGRRLRRGV
jgi:hypothetical protein